MTKWIISGALVLTSVTARADRPTRREFMTRVRATQELNERAFERSAVMSNKIAAEVLNAVDHATALMREVAAHPRLNTLERQVLYDEIIRGAPKADWRGSLARVVWSTIVHHGEDDLNKGRADVGGFEIFRQCFYEAFADVRALVTTRRDADGITRWAARERGQRERVARALVVRLADVLHAMDEHDAQGADALDHAYDRVQQVVAPALALRRRRVFAERAVGAFYGAMIAVNVFVAPMVLPLIQINYVGWVTGFAWGSNLVTGGINVFAFASALVTNLLGRTGRTHALLRDLAAMVRDPGEDETDRTRYRSLRQRIREGQTPLGRHRRRMLDRGYAPADPTAMSCAERLASALF